MLRREQDFVGGTFFDDAAGVHHRDAVGNLGDNAEIVGDKEQAQVHFAAEAIEEFENLFLDGDVEGGGWFVRNQELRASSKGHGDHRALAQTAGELMRILASAIFGFGHGGLFERSDDAAMQQLSGNLRLVGEDRFFDLRADAKDGVERGHRLLKNHGDFATADGAPACVIERQQIFRSSIRGVEKQFAADSGSWRQQAHQRHGEHGFAAAGFADDAERLASLKAERDFVHGFQNAGGGAQFDGERLNS